MESSSVSIKSIELQLVRGISLPSLCYYFYLYFIITLFNNDNNNNEVETCGSAEGFAKESTEIQNIQIADGNLSPFFFLLSLSKNYL